MKIKTSLRALFDLFGESVNDEELAVPVRRFAARLKVLTAHVQRVEEKFDRISEELATHLLALQQKPAVPPTSAPAPETTPEVETSSSAPSEDDMVEQFMRETAEETANATNTTKQNGSVATQIPATKKAEPPATESKA